jgi:hypothetical protein
MASSRRRANWRWPPLSTWFAWAALRRYPGTNARRETAKAKRIAGRSGAAFCAAPVREERGPKRVLRSRGIRGLLDGSGLAITRASHKGPHEQPAVGVAVRSGLRLCVLTYCICNLRARVSQKSAFFLRPMSHIQYSKLSLTEV